MPDKLLNLDQLPELRWLETHQCALTGKLLELDRTLDRLFVSWAGRWQAEEHSFPAFISARELGKLDYFRSFPHLVTFPVTLDPGESNLGRFIAGERLGETGELCLT